MPIFHTKQNTVPPPPAQSSPPNRSRSLFSRNRTPSPVHNDSTTSPTNSQRGGFFSRRRSLSPENPSTNGSNGGFFSRRRSSSSSSSSGGSRDLRKDPTISAARAKVADAEASERAADFALAQARTSVKEAREHVRILERETLEEARRAKAKQAEAKTVSKSAKGLGRHG
ncbi:hypothetical protein QCA50_003898 [Cerrena zonata]|uniref:Uncharacterized protein n=1 Tax=Cerrena zonata TaxID=2478898 RepID=A0AAW0GFM5_9APHY